MLSGVVFWLCLFWGLSGAGAPLRFLSGAGAPLRFWGLRPQNNLRRNNSPQNLSGAPLRGPTQGPHLDFWGVAPKIGKAKMLSGVVFWLCQITLKNKRLKSFYLAKVLQMPHFI
jgi:hypothetical protein